MDTYENDCLLNFNNCGIICNVLEKNRLYTYYNVYYKFNVNVRFFKNFFIMLYYRFKSF